MHRIPPIVAGCIAVGLIALATAWAWLAVTGSPHLTPPAVVACTVIAVAAHFALEALVRHVRRGRPRRAHARPTKTERTSP
ncbi:hypothetical protein ACIP2X_38135 [Streptomyces sp. NPDC089424]|uniref:hypothetical protein n=1 Tax=Streptomyces sp. NPDC089424 TaxID=3365917 RepID=UPI003818DF83